MLIDSVPVNKPQKQNKSITAFSFMYNVYAVLQDESRNSRDIIPKEIGERQEFECEV